MTSGAARLRLRRLRRRKPAILLAGALVACGLLLPARPAAAADPFYSNLLREGAQSYDRGDFLGAARSLRLACFGMLDEPKPLADCLVRLGLAQDRAGDPDGFREAFRRLVEIEERFSAYTQGVVPSTLRTTFEQRLAAVVPAATLDAAPAFRAARKPAVSTTGPKGERASTPAAGTTSASAAPPKTTIPPPAGRAGSAPPAPSTNGGPPAAANPAASAPATGLSPLAKDDRDRMASARRLLQSEGGLKELRQAFDLAHPVADAHPESTEAQYLAAETAYRISRWRDAVDYFHRGGDPGDAQPELLFYMAVSLYESGNRAAAATALKRALPNLKRTAYVDIYTKKIQGS